MSNSLGLLSVQQHGLFRPSNGSVLPRRFYGQWRYRDLTSFLLKHRYTSPPPLTKPTEANSTAGNFFATNSTICITATYRLLPSAKHPDGANDTVSAIKWALENSSSYGGDPARLTVIGHSAGGSIVGTALWGDYILNSNLLDKLSSSTFVFLSAGLWYDVLNPPTSINMPKYHRTDDLERIRREMPQSLFNGASKGAMAKWPKSKFFLAEYEFEEIVKGTTGLLDCWRENMDRELLVEVLEGENHVSYVYGIGLEGSKIGKRLLEIVRGE